jgi:SNF2 family DNA or RNA helicase
MIISTKSVLDFATQALKMLLSQGTFKTLANTSSTQVHLRNVINKSKALKQFREEDVKVVLLSLERSASGMNLIEANYVVLLDPMDGTVEEARAYEIQALGRAHRQGQEQKVTLVRFVIQDSVEEELYLRNKSSGRGKYCLVFMIPTNTFTCRNK